MAPSMPVRCTLLVIAILFAGIFAGCLSVRKRFAARAGCSGGDYRAERRSLASIAFAEYLYHSHTNTENNATYSSFCTGGRLSAVSVLEAAAIWRNLKKQKKCTACFSTVYVAYQSENALQREPSVRVAITEQNAEGFARFTLAEHRYHSHANTRNNAARSGFCTGGRLSAVSVLEAAAIWRNLKKQKKCTVYSSTVHVAYQSENALQREPGVRVAITEQNAEALQGSLLQNTDTIPTQIQETTLPVPVFAPEDGCLLYLFWKLLQSGEI